MVRVFIALELSDEIKDQLTSAQQTLRGCRAHLTFVEPKNIHITAKFLGEVNEKDLPKVKEALKKIAFIPFPVTVEKITVNNPKRPHTVWCAIGDGGEGEKVFQLIEDALAPLGFARETRSFTPHATVARVKSPDPSLFSALKVLEKISYGCCTIRGMVLKKSTLLPHGPVYEDLQVFKW
ncbi:MAG: RNA 2',3'-cyclic phosphodiesterase [Methanoregula sp.]